MAERRMFAKTIIDSDAFLDMPITARLLYYDLAMRADDDGFINAPKKIMRMIGASQDDLNILVFRKFIIPFDSGVVVIKHWRIHNYIRKDTYNSTPYLDEKSQLALDENKAYTLAENIIEDTTTTERPRLVGDTSTQVRLGKDRLGKDSIDKGSTQETPAAEPPSPLVDFSTTTFSDQMIAMVESWIKYKKERRETYKPIGLSNLIAEIQNNVNKYGEEAVMELMRQCMAANYRGIIFDRLKEGAKKNGKGNNGNSGGGIGTKYPLIGNYV